MSLGLDRIFGHKAGQENESFNLFPKIVRRNDDVWKLPPLKTEIKTEIEQGEPKITEPISVK